MNSTKKSILVALLCALVCSAIASASASAEACHESIGSKKYKLCVNGTAVAVPSTVSIASRSTSPMVLNLNLWVHGLTIECKTNTESTSHFRETSTALSLIVRPTFEGCSLTGTGEVAKKCWFPTFHEFNEVTGSFKSGELIAMKPANGATVFWEWPLLSKEGQTCPNTVRGGHSTGGEYACTLRGAGAEAVEHELACASTKQYFTILSGGPETPLSYNQVISLSGVNNGASFKIYEST